MTDLGYALKEWSVAVQALAQGKTILLLRKGGIRETQGRFQVRHDRVWLFPTTEHQRPELLKPAYATAAAPHQPAGEPPESVFLSAWAEITQVLTVDQAEAIAALSPWHIWTDHFATARFQWQPQQPLHVLFLRTYRLEQPIAIPNRPQYRGCRSWLELSPAIAIAPAVPALSDSAYQAQVEAITSLLAAIKRSI